MMVLLDVMDLIKPDIGLIFWTSIIFISLWFFLGRKAFKPIAQALKDREDSIDDALRSADKAREEMAAMTADNERIIREAKEERTKILKEAKDIAVGIVDEAKEKAKVDVQKIREDAISDIENKKMAAIIEVKNLVGNSAVELAEKVLSRELKDKADQEAYINSEIGKINLN